MVIAVLPFRNVSDNRDLDYFAIGFTEDLITDLSKFNHLQVISHHSTEKTHLDAASDVEVSASLKADFIVRGSFRFSHATIRINVQLSNSASSTVVWADKYDQPLSSILSVQDEITNRIVSSIHNNIDRDILLKGRRKAITNLEAYDCWLKGYGLLKKGTPEADLEARTYFEQALRNDPNYARAHTGISLSYFNEWSCQLWDKWQENQDGAFENALKAVSLDEYDAISLAVLGRIYLYKGNFEKAEHCSRKSLRLNANDADTLSLIATSLTYLGYPAEAKKLYQKAVKLNPLNKERYNGIALFIYFEAGNIDKSIEMSRQISFCDSWVDIPAFMAGAFFCKGDLQQASLYWSEFEENFRLKIAKGKPFTTKDAINWFFFANPFKTGTRLNSLINYLDSGNQDILSEGLSAIVAQENYFKHEGDIWEFCFSGRSVTLPEVKGFLDLAALINQPFTEIHCIQLMGATVAQEGKYLILDEKAKREYRKQIESLRLEIQEAEEYNQPEQIIKLKTEYDDIIEHLSKALGKGSKARSANTPAERIRSAITWRIRNAIKKIKNHHPDLASHLSKSIHTGTFCSYSPEHNIEWAIKNSS